MSRDVMRGIWAAGLVVAAAGLVGPGAAIAPAQAASRAGVAARAVVPAAARGAQLWVRRYNGPGNGSDSAQALAVGPGGTAVFVTGGSSGGIATVAYKAATGARLWVARAAGVQGRSAAVSPDGRTVFVTGDDQRVRTGPDIVTLAFNAATGTLRWAARFHRGSDYARSVAVSPGGTTVFVTGTSNNTYATIAYAAATGRRLWMALSVKGGANSMSVSPGGSRVYVTGESWGGATTKMDYATVAYSAATGRQLWTARFSSPGAHGDHARSVAVSPGGTTVYVTGDSSGDYATVAYSAATGRQLWASRYNGTGNSSDFAQAIVAGPAGDRVYVTGRSKGTASSYDYATIAYSAATGKQAWARRYAGPGGLDSAQAMAASPAGAAVYVTGISAGLTSGFDYATVAYSTATGRQLWASRYNGPNHAEGYDSAFAIAVGPHSSRVYVTGLSMGTTGQGEDAFDYATIAYQG